MTPQLVQEALPTTQRIAQEQFVFLVCQHGTEPTIKARWTAENSPFRLAFSRPGLLTFKIVEPATGQTPGSDVTLPEDWMIRQSGLSLGQLRGGEAAALIEQTLQLSGFDWDTVHVFERDSGLPGDRGFEPGPTELSKEIGKCLLQAFRQAGSSPRLNIDADPGDRVLDVVLIEPNHWLIGHHRAATISQRWPGGAYSVSPPNEMISRAYLKMAEAVAWSGLPLQPGDEIAEIGSAPGGACQRLLDLGLRVTGIDPAEMDPMLLSNPRFEHWRSKSSGVRRKRYAKFRWLAADANVAPNYTLDCVEDIVNYNTSRIQGLLLTLKLSSYDLAEHMGEYLDRIRSWGYSRVEVRQLASNRRECCVVAQRIDANRTEKPGSEP
jgi:23S rRNA (cytidine2498-2'-O)-methyltransferase